MHTVFKNPTVHPIQRRRNAASPSGAINRLLAAAVVNSSFRDLLLSDPEQALAQGYGGESFTLSPQKRKMVLSIQADNLQDFALQIIYPKVEGSQFQSLDWVPTRQNALVLERE